MATLLTLMLRKLLDKTIQFYGSIPWYKPQAARGMWKRGRVLIALGGEENEKKGTELLRKSMALRRELTDDEREEPGLGDEDWDVLVFYFWR